MILNDKIYDVLKWVAIIALPASITAFTTIATLLGMPAETITIISGVAIAVDTLLGTLLGISSVEYS